MPASASLPRVGDGRRRRRRRRRRAARSPRSRQISRQLAEWVDRAGSRRAGVGDHRRAAFRPAPIVVRDRAAQRVGPHPGRPVGRDHPHLVGPEAEHARCAGERRVRLVGHVDHGRSSIGPISVSRAQASAVRFAAEPPETRTPLRRLRVADPLPEPVDHDQLERARARRTEPPAGVDVERARDQVAERPRPRPLTGDERQVAGMADPGDVRQDVPLEPRQDLVEGNRFLGRRDRDPLVQLLRSRRAHDRTGRPGHAVDQHVDRAVAEPPHRLGVQRQRRAVRWCHCPTPHYEVRAR